MKEIKFRDWVKEAEIKYWKRKAVLQCQQLIALMKRTYGGN
jgi:hypothetical protein